MAEDEAPLQPEEDQEEQDDGNKLERFQAATTVLWRGFLKVLMLLFLFFVAFSVWFTLRAAVCSMVEDLEGNSRGCAATLRKLLAHVCRGLRDKLRPPKWARCLPCDAIDMFNRLVAMPSPTIPQWIMGPASDFFKTLVFLSALYWMRFWGVQTYRKEIRHEDGATIRDRFRLLLTHLGDVSLEQVDEFRTYLLVVLVSGLAFATLLFPLCWMTQLQGIYGFKNVVYVSWKAVAWEVFWQLFMIHFISSSLVADAIFNVGPLMTDVFPGDKGFVWYLGVSSLWTAFVYPLGRVLLWWWNGSVA